MRTGHLIHIMVLCMVIYGTYYLFTHTPPPIEPGAVHYVHSIPGVQVFNNTNQDIYIAIYTSPPKIATGTP